MSDVVSYTKTRTVAIIITVVLLLIGSIVYFSTNIAERNNEMMYKEIYGENATIKINIIVNYNTDVKPVLA
jgi:hypothetical protein